MKNKTKLTRMIGMGVLCLLLALPAISEAAAFRFDTQTRALFAGFDSVDETGCIFTSIAVVAFVVEGSVTNRTLAITLARSDFCEGVSILAAQGQATDFAFSVPSNLQKGSVAGTVTAFNEATGANIDFDIALTFTGFGPIETGNQTLHFDLGPTIVNQQFHGKTRDATVAGVISDGTTDFAQGASSFGQISDIDFGEVTVTTGQP